MNKLTFKIEKMKCAGCVSAIETALNTLDGIDEVNVSLETHQASVNTTQSPEIIAKVISDAGFPATLL